jgi:hypothetical protein
LVQYMSETLAAGRSLAFLMPMTSCGAGLGLCTTTDV